jgi:hypothetical protein
VLSRGQWQGYVSSLDEPKRAPLDLAWQALFDLVPGPFVAAVPEVEEQRLFARTWPSKQRRFEWVTDDLLQLAAALGTASLTQSLLAELESPSMRRRTLAVNALATATGRDLRRDAAGAIRPVTAIAEAYRREFPAR